MSELEALKKVLPKASRGLEIGVGTGRFASALRITMGIDPSYAMMELAIERGVNVRRGAGEDLPFFENTFDYAAIIITLCFVKDPVKVLKEAGRVLKKHGKLIIGIIDKDSFLGKFYQRKKSIFYKHAKFFSVKELVNLLKAAGFSRFTHYQTVFYLPEKINSIEKSKRGFGEGGFVVTAGEKK
ncbi:MAG: class I SAM-dependent methyltransferase [Candidatus Omnitrophica bacterium]|nr:class I SAM-dependent methyltransferase [Candidatus Omnitrophota bacterium]MBU0896360.1 class I SAM-dependent methyltransferase [Candidatus Omnitrophota bacterium]MBU1134439.1 class I SAM-dependent methyltransferase [Candidatus Omnitrophota bacterium]MBU1367500.1 class I SAM-dependent methyltransferase [Candidatus Omnitrophota bacterium]MBU1810277.1 class I SAM-dependent methyltransferase [Candidatus Omnitrophota bacterium]